MTRAVLSISENGTRIGTADGGVASANARRPVRPKPSGPDGPRPAFEGAR